VKLRALQRAFGSFLFPFQVLRYLKGFSSDEDAADHAATAKKSSGLGRSIA
jgi:hypothetical protein